MTPLKILVVEDEITSLKLLKHMMSEYGHVDTAVTGSEALEAVRLSLEQNTPYHFICLDIMLPEMDGQTALIKMREMESSKGIMPGDGAKIVMTTAMGDSRNVLESFRGQADGYIVKPVSRPAILEQLRLFGFVE